MSHMTEMNGSRAVKVHANEAIGLLMNPQSIAFIGASSSYEKIAGQAVINVGQVGYTGEIFAVNARGEQVANLTTVKKISDLPHAPDLAFITIPAASCAGAIRELGAIGTRTAIVAVGGFAEMGTEEGRALSADLLRASREAGVRIVGPVCNGIYSTPNQLSVGYNEIHTRGLNKGRVGLVSHSGALVAPFVSLLDKSGAGLSRYISAGSELDLGLADFVSFLSEDPETDVIALILDHVGDGQKFRQAVRRARANGKEVVVLKLGNSPLGREATLAHSSHLSGTKRVYDAFFAADGVRNTISLECLALVSAALSGRPAPTSGGVVACSTSGGGAILLADLLSESAGAAGVPKLEAGTVQTISQHLLFDSSLILNPFDLGLGGRENYGANIMALAMDSSTAVLIVFGTPMATPAKREQLAGAVVSAAKARPDVPVIYLSPAPLFDDERIRLEKGGIPVCTSTLDAIATAVALLPLKGIVDEIGHSGAFDTALKGPQSEHQSKLLLRELKIDFPEERLVQNISEAQAAATAIGFPVVLKATGHGIWHKSEMGLVKVGISSAEQLESAMSQMAKTIQGTADIRHEGYLICKQLSSGVETLLGVTRDPEFGLVALFGPGGVMAELFGADAMSHLALPTNKATIRKLLETSPLHQMLGGFRGGEVYDKEAFIDLVFSVCEAALQIGDDLMELDLNPVKVAPEGEGAWALDALVVLKKESEML